MENFLNNFTKFAIKIQCRNFFLRQEDWTLKETDFRSKQVLTAICCAHGKCVTGSHKDGEKKMARRIKEF